MIYGISWGLVPSSEFLPFQLHVHGRHTSMSSDPTRHSFWTGLGDASPGDYNRTDCAPEWHFPSSARGFRCRRRGSAGLVSAHRLRSGRAAVLAAGHPWHMLILQEGQKALNVAAGCPDICRPSPSSARLPGPGQFKGLVAFPGRAGGLWRP